MSRVAVHEGLDVSRVDRVPACQWGFNTAREFHHISGDSAGLFHHPPAELLHRHVSIIDDPNGTWSARLDRLFFGKTPVEQWTASGSGREYALIHIPLRANDGTVMHAAGFAYPPGRPFPAAPELELAARAVLQALETERGRATRFLHDIVAQSLSGTGLQLELLNLEIRAKNVEPPSRTAEIQESLDQVLKLIREFSAKDTK